MMSPETPNRPWQRAAADLFEFDGKTYLVTLDCYSDFFALDYLRSPSSVYVIRKLKAHFARHGIPDNGSQFTSRDFLKFSRDWDFEHLTSSPHRSQGNGKAESAVKEAKKILRKCRASRSDAFLALLDHRNTPPASVQVSPAQRLFNRRTRSLLPMTANLLAPQAVSDNELCRAKFEQVATSSILQPRCCRSRSLEKKRCSKTKTVSARQARIAEKNCAYSTG